MADFEPHIKGSGGIISTIAAKVGCEWNTAEKWIKNNASLKALYDAECETVLDVAESVVYGNVQAAAKLQADARKVGVAAIVDSADAKWLFDWAGPTWDGKTVWFNSNADNPGTLVLVTE